MKNIKILYFNNYNLFIILVINTNYKIDLNLELYTNIYI